jgi:hypothetical protein
MRSKLFKKWKKWEKEKLKQQLRQGINIKDVKIPGRNWNGIRRVAKRLKLIEPLINPHYTEEQKAKLRELKQTGCTAKQIAELNLLGLPHPTFNALQHACSRAGAVDPNRSRGRENRKIWKPGEKEDFRDFILKHSEDIPTKQIAMRFGVVEGTVRLWKRRLIPKPPALPFEEWILEREKELEKLLSKMRKKRWALEPQERQCKTCGRVWYKHRSFYFYEEIKTNGYTRRYFWRDCKICVAKKRRQKKIAQSEKIYSGN